MAPKVEGVSFGTENFNKVNAINTDDPKKKQNSVWTAPQSFNAVIQGIGNILNGNTTQSDGACFSA